MLCKCTYLPTLRCMEYVGVEVRFRQARIAEVHIWTTLNASEHSKHCIAARTHLTIRHFMTFSNCSKNTFPQRIPCMYTSLLADLTETNILVFRFRSKAEGVPFFWVWLTLTKYLRVLTVFYHTEKQGFGYPGFQIKFKAHPPNRLKSSPVSERSVYSLQNYICFSRSPLG